jgi:hypothetical protein
MLAALGLNQSFVHLRPPFASNETDAPIGENYTLHQIRNESSSASSLPSVSTPTPTHRLDLGHEPRNESPGALDLPPDFDFNLDPFGGQDALLFIQHWFAMGGAANLLPDEAGQS